MANTEVLLVQPVQGLGAEGDQVKVKAGYARNYLFPQKIAFPVNRANRKQVEALLKARAEREVRELDNAKAVADKLATLRLAFAVKTGEGGKMFGSITAADLHKRLEEEGLVVERRRLLLPAPVKTLGKHTATIKLHSDVSVELEFEIVSENPIEEPDAAPEA
jgi:large subunit ribosomal protein L9